MGQQLSEERLNVCPSWCKYEAIKIVYGDDKLTISELTKKARTNCEKEGVGLLDSIISNNPSQNIVQMAGPSMDRMKRLG